MAESKLDIIVNARKALEGIKQVTTGLQRLGAKASDVTAQMSAKFDKVKNSVFSLQGALVGLATGATARSIFKVGENLDFAERGLRTVTTSAAAASVQLERIRKIEDEFQSGDLPMVNSFRLLAANAIPDAEKALRTIANVALSTAEDIETVTNAVLAGNERSLRRLGIQLVDLGTGKVSIAFGNMRIEANKTDEEIRKGILQIMEKGFPDATKEMADSASFQLKRVMDVWDDLEVAVNRGGIQQTLASMFKQFADTADQQAIATLGANIADIFKRVAKTISQDIAFVVDFMRPGVSLMFAVVSRALKTFESLPPAIQTFGLLGFLFFGWQGRLIMIAGLALADKLGIKFDDIMKKLEGVTGAVGSGVAAAQDAASKSAVATALGLDEFIKLIGKDDARKYVQAYWEGVEKNEKEAANRLKKKLAEGRKIEASGEGLLKAGGKSERELKMEARLEELRQLTESIQGVEAEKRNPLFDPEQAAAMGQFVSFIQTIRREVGELTPEFEAAAKEYFRMQGEAVALTRQWTDQENDRRQRAFDAAQMLGDATMELQELKDATMALSVDPSERDLVAAKLKLERELMTGRVFLQAEDLDWLHKRLEAMDVERKKQEELLALEESRIQARQNALQMQNRLNDLLAGRDTPSRESRVSEQIALLEARTKQAVSPQGRAQIESEVDNAMLLERKLALEGVVNEMDREHDKLVIVNNALGLNADAREELIRVNEKWLELQRQGIDLSDEEIERLKKTSHEIQEQLKQERVTSAVNGFVDKFNVGWDTIIKSGDQAYSHLEDALTQFVQKGKLDFTSFVDFVSQELIRLGIRASLGQLFGGGQGAGAGGLFGQLLGGIGSLFKGPGFGAAASGAGAASGAATLDASAAGVGFTLEDFAQRGGMFNWRGRIPGFQHGGTNRHERLIRISEGNTEEAIIPMRGGKVPVQLKGRSGVTISAPITIVTPDSSGVRRSEGQVQASMSSALLRASRRIN